MGLQTDYLTKGKMPWEKEFIDFRYNDKNISDFGMVAVSDGDRYQVNYGAFTDETDTINGLSGQYFWGTRWEPKKIRYILASDGMTEQQIREFKLHFQPGKYGQLEDMHYPNRFCYVRLAAPPEFTFVPFRVEESRNDIEPEGAGVVTNKMIFTSNLYKGEGSIEFIQDMPFEFSYLNLSTYTSNQLYEALQQNNDNAKMVIRALNHSGVPLADSWKNNSTLATMKVCSVGDEVYALSNYTPSQWKIYNQTGIPTDSPTADWDYPYNLPSATIKNTSVIPCYNPSEKPVKPRIEIDYTLIPTSPKTNGAILIGPLEDETSYESIVAKSGSMCYPLIDGSIIFSETRYCAPEYIRQINKAINIVFNFAASGQTQLITLEEQLRQEIVNIDVLKWTMKAITILEGQGFITNNIIDTSVTKQSPNAFRIFTTGTSLNWARYFNGLMFCIIHNSSSGYGILKLVLDGENGMSSYSCIRNQNLRVENNSITYDSGNIFYENCSNIMLTSYLELEGGNTLTEDCKINGHSKIIFSRTVAAAKITYKYTYL